MKFKSPKPVKEKKCRVCKKPFRPYQPLQVVCELACAIEYSKIQSKKKEDGEIKKKIAGFKDSLRTRTYWLNLLQKTFNEFIRLRDKGKDCICCPKPLGTKYHAGHFWSVGAYPGLRFDEDNCFGQREECNLHLHGNHGEYALNLPKRIGQERFDQLNERRNQELKLTLPEIKEKINHYKIRIKHLKG